MLNDHGRRYYEYPSPPLPPPPPLGERFTSTQDRLPVLRGRRSRGDLPGRFRGVGAVDFLSAGGQDGVLGGGVDGDCVHGGNHRGLFVDGLLLRAEHSEGREWGYIHENV